MKSYLYPLGTILVAAVLSRLPHPARDISKLDPVQAISIYMEDGSLCIETDIGDRGTGPDLTAAAEDMKTAAAKEIYLETAEYLILSPEVELTPEFYALLRPSARVCYMEESDLKTMTAWLAAHPPKRTLAQVRAEVGKET